MCSPLSFSGIRHAFEARRVLDSKILDDQFKYLTSHVGDIDHALISLSSPCIIAANPKRKRAQSCRALTSDQGESEATQK